MPSIEVAFLPQLLESPLTGRTAVVIDVLRATTTLTWALAHGAKSITPCLDVEEAMRLRDSSGAHQASLLGGERGGAKLPGFDLGNSPAEYSPDAVRGRSIIFTTTNGTRAMLACAEADSILLGAFSNLSKLTELLSSSEDVTLVCAGTDGGVTAEDVLLAGALTTMVRQCHLDTASACSLNDQAVLAGRAWHQMKNEEETLCEALTASQGGRNLQKLGFDADIRLAAEVDFTSAIGALDMESRTVEAA